MDEPFKGFAEIKRCYPSAEYFEITVGGHPASTLLGKVGQFAGKLNGDTFEGRAPGTVMFMGPNASSGEPTGTLSFVHRPEGWNTAFCDETQAWEEIRWAASDKPPYESADFFPLSAMKIG